LALDGSTPAAHATAVVAVTGGDAISRNLIQMPIFHVHFLGPIAI
jgi:hypothetical protein